ncbi:MAG: hypothetical protein WCJ97_00060 [Phycisphaerae bacterium]
MMRNLLIVSFVAAMGFVGANLMAETAAPAKPDCCAKCTCKDCSCCKKDAKCNATCTKCECCKTCAPKKS